MTWSVLSDYQGLFLWSVVVTLELAICAWILAFIIGILMSVLRSSQIRTLQIIGGAYVEFFRNVPPLVIVFMVFFALPTIGIRLSGFTSVICGVGLYGGAMMTEYIRSGIASLPRGQFESAIASGMTSMQAMRFIILPQAISIVVPPLGTETINVIKNTSLGAAVSVSDILGNAYLIGSRTFAYDVVFLAAACMYLCLTIPTAAVFNYLESLYIDEGLKMFGLSWLFRATILLFLLNGFAMTLMLSVVSCVIAFILAVALVAARTSGIKLVSVPATAYIELTRGLPLMLIIFAVFFVSEPLLGITLTPFQAAIIALSGFMGTLLAETLRAGLNSIDKGLTQAATAQGFTGPQVFWLIKFPLMTRRMAPALISQFIALVKATSLTVVIGVPELLDRASIISTRPPFQPMPVLLLVAFAYFVVNYSLSIVGSYLQKRNKFAV